MPTPYQVFETILYSDDLAASQQFYEECVNLRLLGGSPASFLVFRVGTGVLLIFDPNRSSLDGRGIPSHGARGPGHLAFAANDDEIDAWKQHFESAGIEIEEIITWPEGGRSLYVRDPSGNSIEFAPPTLWGGGWEFGAPSEN